MCTRAAEPSETCGSAFVGVRPADMARATAATSGRLVAVTAQAWAAVDRAAGAEVAASAKKCLKRAPLAVGEAAEE